MSQTCSQHPERPSEGNCLRCGKATCALCKVEDQGNVFCSMLCFTEGPSSPADPLAGVGLDASSTQMPKAPLDDESVVLPASQAAATDMETSILDMGDTPRRETEPIDGGGSSVMDVPELRKDNTSILGMDVIAKPQGAAEKMPYVMPVPPDAGAGSDADAMMPIVLPSTRRSTIQSNCVFHPDTPAVVLCSKCGDPVCTMCVEDTEHGGRCSPNCRRSATVRRQEKRSGLLTVTVVAVAAIAIGGILFIVNRPEAPPPAKASGVEIASTGSSAETEAKTKAEADAKAAKEKADAEARMKAESEAKAAAEKKEKEEAEAKAKAEKEARDKAEAEAMAKAIAEKKAKEEAEAKAKAEAEAKAKAAEMKAKEEADAKAKAEAEAMAKAKAEKEAREKEEARLKAEAAAKAAAEKKAKEEADARAKAEAMAKAEAEKKAKEEAAAKAVSIENLFRKASGLIREATPAFHALADEPGALSQAAIPRIDAVVLKLSDAHGTYVSLLEDAPDRALVERRISILDDLLATLQHCRARCNDAR
jgi:hypothetical protein